MKKNPYIKCADDLSEMAKECPDYDLTNILNVGASNILKLQEEKVAILKSAYVDSSNIKDIKE